MHLLKEGKDQTLANQKTLKDCLFHLGEKGVGDVDKTPTANGILYNYQDGNQQDLKKKIQKATYILRP